MLMWLDHYSSACRECPDLVAVYEAIDGRLALLLRQTLVPLPEESPAFRRATRSAARIIVDKLRAAGFRRGFIVLQWHPLGPGADIMRTWPCRNKAAPGPRGSRCSPIKTPRKPTSRRPGPAATKTTPHA